MDDRREKQECQDWPLYTFINITLSRGEQRFKLKPWGKIVREVRFELASHFMRPARLIGGR
jgi:hypothetical protein